MTEDGILPLPTLGERLDAQGRRLAARLLTPLPWAGPLGVFIGHAAGLVVCAGRFDRIESDPDRPVPLVAPVVGGRSRRAYGAPRAEPPAPAAPGARPAGDPAPGRLPAPPTPAEAAGGPAGDALPAPARARLRSAVGPAADAMRVHDDEPADALARAHRADAVTIGRDVFFRHGRLRPREERGFGLLVHEATHVLALMRPGAAWHRATGAGARAEEAEALANERAAAPGVLAPGAGLPPGPSSSPRSAPAAGHSPGSPLTAPPPTTPPPATPSASPAARPLAAATDRDGAPAAAAPPLDVGALRRDLIDDVMRQLRTEFERGG
ncbi:DUF4157 domain-containing protein [Streptomyces sp. APSN-46.1]|uniref:eCIS core domain-containing protein n=1 Tax=Streptomyces sp. APSN-46.1 TaxID=2929049 RepID=UPI001FB3F4E5|nr:DUF4157 domain-containing protein [Streptomyces sp. APSN-46.1]MCJ1676501.1 DUF4157 domain-containing protein [Streptomyces sp. APSN-46.1]